MGSENQKNFSIIYTAPVYSEHHLIYAFNIIEIDVHGQLWSVARTAFQLALSFGSPIVKSTEEGKFAFL